MLPILCHLATQLSSGPIWAIILKIKNRLMIIIKNFMKNAHFQ